MTFAVYCPNVQYGRKIFGIDQIERSGEWLILKKKVTGPGSIIRFEPMAYVSVHGVVVEDATVEE